MKEMMIEIDKYEPPTKPTITTIKQPLNDLMLQDSLPRDTEDLKLQHSQSETIEILCDRPKLELPSNENLQPSTLPNELLELQPPSLPNLLELQYPQLSEPLSTSVSDIREVQPLITNLKLHPPPFQNCHPPLHDVPTLELQHPNQLQNQMQHESDRSEMQSTTNTNLILHQPPSQNCQQPSNDVPNLELQHPTQPQNKMQHEIDRATTNLKLHPTISKNCQPPLHDVSTLKLQYPTQPQNQMQHEIDRATTSLKLHPTISQNCQPPLHDVPIPKLQPPTQPYDHMQFPGAPPKPPDPPYIGEKKIATELPPKKCSDDQTIAEKLSLKEKIDSPKVKTPLKLKRLRGGARNEILDSNSKIRKPTNSQTTEKRKFLEHFYKFRGAKLACEQIEIRRSTKVQFPTINAPICAQPTRPSIRIQSSSDLTNREGVRETEKCFDGSTSQ